MRAETLQQLQIVPVCGLEIDVRPVAEALRIRIFSEDHNGHVRLLAEAAVDAERGGSACRFDIRLNAFVDRVAVRKIGARVAVALPGYRPAARLLGKIVGAVAGHQHMRSGR